ncbi:MAG: hypothetical protein KIT09_24500 [Bryobacteraceae bacterium]|nr:hypothetical protein [Bryobacteraceae bacterium]
MGLRADSPRRAVRVGGGGSRWHGRLFWNFRNDALDAVPHEVTQTGGDKGILRRNQYGFNISGPLVIPKLYDGGRATFFSVSYEGVRETIGRSFLRTIPTLPERTGDFGAVVDKAGEPLPIFDPLSTRENPNYDPSQPVALDNLQYRRDPFPGNRIPTSRLDPVALDGLQYYPAPNIGIGPFFQNNYAIYSPGGENADGMRIKVDHTLRERHRLSSGFAFSNGLSRPAEFFPTIANPGSPGREFRSRNGSLEHVLTMSRNSVNNFRVSFWTSTSEAGGAAEGDDGVFPFYRFLPYLSMGRAYPVSRTSNTQYEISDGFSFRRGKHSLRFSGEMTQYQLNSFWPQYPAGRYDFTEGLTSLPGIINTGHPFASFVLGLSRFAEGSLVQHPSYFRRKVGDLAARDEWEIRPGLTINIGLRLLVSTPRVEKYDRQATVDFDAVNPESGRPGALVFAGKGGQPHGFQPVVVTPDPSMTVSWNPQRDSKTVVRLTLRRFHSIIPMYSGQWGTQGFNGTPTYITQNAQLEPALILRNGFPPLPRPLPDLRPDAANDTVADLVDRTGRVPTYNSASLSLERQFPYSFVLAVGANHTHGRDMLASNDSTNPNAVPLDALQYRDLLNEESFRRSLRPFPQYQRFDVYSAYPAGRYQRTEAYLRAEKRTSQGMSMRAVYEFSKQYDDYSTAGGIQDYYNRRKEWALNPSASPHTLSMSYMYELPFGPNKGMMTGTDWKRYLVEGWTFSGVTTYSSGDPITLSAIYNNTGNIINVLYVNAVPGADPSVPNPGPDMWFNPNAFLNPPDFSIGNVSRTHPQLRNPSRQNHDLSVTKRFTLTSERALEFVGTAFNFVNHAVWNTPDAEIGTLEAPNVNAGRIIGSRGGRVIQLGLVYSF